MSVDVAKLQALGMGPMQDVHEFVYNVFKLLPVGAYAVKFRVTYECIDSSLQFAPMDHEISHLCLHLINDCAPITLRDLFEEALGPEYVHRYHASTTLRRNKRSKCVAQKASCAFRAFSPSIQSEHTFLIPDAAVLPLKLTTWAGDQSSPAL